MNGCGGYGYGGICIGGGADVEEGAGDGLDDALRLDAPTDEARELGELSLFIALQA